MSASIQQATVAVRAGIDSDPAHGAVVPPVYLSSNYSFAGLGRKRRYDYTRSGNPTRDQLADALARLEGGAGAVVTGSGMAAVSLTTQLLRRGDRVVAAPDIYGGTHRLLCALAERGDLVVDWVDLRDAGARAAALARRPAMVWVETPSNPLLRITDVRAVAAAARAAGALCVVDNTFLSPALQRPLALGADVVVHSTTKYLNGHSDVVGGAVMAADAAVHERLAWWANCTGITGAPFDAFLTLRGLRTLAVRMAQHERNARAVARLLAEHPAVRRVHDPGDAAHPDHALARAQQTGFGGMLAFELVEADGAVEVLLDHLRHFSLAESLGGVESLVAHPATMTHAAMDAEAQRRAGISPHLLRLSVGIEDPADLCADLAGALDAVQRQCAAGLATR